jgi:hypothetical protein
MPTPYQPKKFVCRMEGCDAPHCRKCGHHYDPACSEGKDICDGCQIGMASADAEHATELHGGNYEEAARVENW